LIRENILHAEIKIKVGNILLQGLPITSCLRQRDALSPILFNKTFEKNQSHGEVNRIRLNSCIIGTLAYADA
jgi:hypothetical protein